MILLCNNALEKYSGFVYTVEGQEVVFRLKVVKKSLPPRQPLHLLLANTPSWIHSVCPKDKFLRSLPGFLCAPRQRLQLLQARDSSKKSTPPPYLWIAICFICDYCQILKLVVDN